MKTRQSSKPLPSLDDLRTLVKMPHDWQTHVANLETAYLDALDRLAQRSETPPALQQVGQVMHAMANDGKCRPVAWFNGAPDGLPDGTPIYIRGERQG